MHGRYKKVHRNFYTHLKESTSEPVLTPLGIANVIFGIPTMSIVDPDTEMRVGVEKIFNDIEFVSNMNDSQLLKWCKIRWGVKRFIIVYMGLLPFIVVFIWLNNQIVIPAKLL
ncbi:MAG: hypothetical protein AB8B89_07210 [Gammaproteobacteria bacterium]